MKTSEDRYGHSDLVIGHSFVIRISTFVIPNKPEARPRIATGPLQSYPFGLQSGRLLQIRGLVDLFPGKFGLIATEVAT